MGPAGVDNGGGRSNVGGDGRDHGGGPVVWLCSLGVPVHPLVGVA